MASCLLIDDDDITRLLLDRLVRQHSGSAVSLAWAPAVADAQELLRGTAFDIIFLDNRIEPFDDFRQSVPVLKPLIGDARLILISAYAGEDYFSEAEDFGIETIVEKGDLKTAIEAGLLDAR